MGPFLEGLPDPILELCNFSKITRALLYGRCSDLLLLSALETVFLLQNSLCSMSLMVLTVCWALRKCVWFANNSTNWKRSRQVLCREKREDEMQGYVCCVCVANPLFATVLPSPFPFPALADTSVLSWIIFFHFMPFPC